MCVLRVFVLHVCVLYAYVCAQHKRTQARRQIPEDSGTCLVLLFSPTYSLETEYLTEPRAKLAVASPSHPPVSTPVPPSTALE